MNHRKKLSQHKISGQVERKQLASRYLDLIDSNESLSKLMSKFLNNPHSKLESVCQSYYYHSNLARERASRGQSLIGSLQNKIVIRSTKFGKLEEFSWVLIVLELLFGDCEISKKRNLFNRRRFGEGYNVGNFRIRGLNLMRLVSVWAKRGVRKPGKGHFVSEFKEV